MTAIALLTLSRALSMGLNSLDLDAAKSPINKFLRRILVMIDDLAPLAKMARARGYLTDQGKNR